MLGECNTIVSAYTLYRHLQQYCTHQWISHTQVTLVSYVHITFIDKLTEINMHCADVGLITYSGTKESTAQGVEDADEPVLTEADLIEEEEEADEDPHVLEYIAGNYSPKLFSPGDIDDLEAVIYDPEDDMKKLELARKQVKSFGIVRVSKD